MIRFIEKIEPDYEGAYYYPHVRRYGHDAVEVWEAVARAIPPRASSRYRYAGHAVVERWVAHDPLAPRGSAGLYIREVHVFCQESI